MDGRQFSHCAEFVATNMKPDNGPHHIDKSSRTQRRGAGRQVSAAHLAKLAAAREAVVLPPITYPEDLPVSAHRREISDAIAHNQVVIVAGETGSGKTTQLPKILLELGRGRVGQIGHTQPRRIAARSVAERIVFELGTPLGEVVGYQVRFTDQSSERTLVKVMTDGILLASLQRDPKLLAYDTIIIDEAHERSLNIDFLLGYLAKLLPTRPDLKLIITSATIDSERFAEHFSPANLARLGGAEPYIIKALPDKAPIIEVTGRTYPVEIRYSPLIPDDIGDSAVENADIPADEDTAVRLRVKPAMTGNTSNARTINDGKARSPKPSEPQTVSRKKTSQSRKVDTERDLMTAIVDACLELMIEGPGDILVFLSGEREIKDAADALTGAFKDQIDNPHRPDAIEILPLYSRLSAAEQHRIFAPHNRRRIVLATNVAETSLTVPGIRYVVDTGLARISRYSKTTKVQRLPIEAISRASANQRAGRSGREAPGIAIRLYGEGDFDRRDEFTEPEILRTSLASVLLQMIAVGVVSDPDEVAAFPFVQAPDTRAVRDGVMLLRELGALEVPDGGKGGFDRVQPKGFKTGSAASTTETRQTANVETAETAGNKPIEPNDASSNSQQLRRLPASRSDATFTRNSGENGGAMNARNEGSGQAGDVGGGENQNESKVGLTRIGRLLAGLPIDPRLARMVIAGVELGVGAEVVVIAAALSIQDPRERPEDVREQADQLHARFVDPSSDFLTLLNLWNYLQAQQKELSGSAFRRLCKAEYIHYLRVREWQDLVNQIRSMAAEVGLKMGRIADDANDQSAGWFRDRPALPDGSPQPPEKAGSRGFDGRASGAAQPTRSPHRNGDLIHRALLTGLLSQLGMQETKEIKASSVAGLRGEARARALRQAAKRARNEYLGARGARFAIYPGSPLSKRPPAWIMAGELVETSRLWARQVARINPDWIESAAEHLVRRSYTNPHWSAKKGAAMAVEKVSLYGLPIVADRKVLYSKLDPEAAREMFIRHALVNGEWQSPHKFLEQNQHTITEIAKTAARSRRRDLLVGDDDLYNFYAARLPNNIVSSFEFDKWYKAARQRTPDILKLTVEALEHPVVDLTGFPDHWTQGEFTFPLSYEMAPGTDADGVTLHIPLDMLARVEDAGFDWLVPGMVDDLCVATIRSLPKAVRVGLVPAPDTGKQIAAWLRANTPSWADMTRAGSMAGTFAGAFTQAVRALKGFSIPDDAWDGGQQEKLPAHFRMRFAVEDANRKPLATSLSLADLKTQFAPQIQASAQTAIAQAYQIARDGLTAASVVGPNETTKRQVVGPPDSRGRTADEIAGQARNDGKGLTQKLASPESAIAALQDIVHPSQVAAANAAGVRAKLLEQNRLKTERVTSRWTGKQALTLAASPYPSTEALVEDLQKAAVLALTSGGDNWVVEQRSDRRNYLHDANTITTREQLDAATAYVRQHLEHEVYQIVGHVVAALTAYGELDKEIARHANKLPLLATLTDVRAQARALIYNGFIAATPPERLPHLVRYLRAATHRIEKAAANPSRDIGLAQEVRLVEQEIATAKAQRIPADKVTEARWLLEELRVSLFAQELGTQGKVSAKRITKLLATSSP